MPTRNTPNHRDTAEMSTRTEKPTLAIATAATEAEAAAVGDLDSIRDIGGLSPTNSIDRKIMSEDEVSTLVQNALTRARQATSSFSPRVSPTSSRGGGGALSPSSVGSSSSWGVRSPVQNDTTMSMRGSHRPSSTSSSDPYAPNEEEINSNTNQSGSALAAATTALLQKRRSLNNRSQASPYSINTNLPPRTSRYSSSSPRTPQTPYSASSIDGFSTPGGSETSSDFVDLSNSSSLMSTDYDGEQSIGTATSSDEIIRKVEEEIANARKAAQEASRRLAGVSANLTVKRSTSSGTHTAIDDKEGKDSTPIFVSKSTSLDSLSRKVEATTKDDDLQEEDGAQSLDDNVIRSSNQPSASGLSTSADGFTFLSGQTTMLDKIGKEFDEQHIYDSAMGVMGEEFDIMDDTVGRSNKSSRRLDVSGLFSMEDDGVGRLPTPSFSSFQREQHITTQSSVGSSQRSGETSPAQGTLENPVDVSAMPDDEEQQIEDTEVETEETKQSASVDLSAMPDDEVQNSEDKEEEAEEYPVSSIDSSDTPHDEAEQQSQDGKKEVEELSTDPIRDSLLDFQDTPDDEEPHLEDVEETVEELPSAPTDDTCPKIDVTHNSDDEIEVAMSPSEEIESLLQPGSDEVKEVGEDEEKFVDTKCYSQDSFDNHDRAPPNDEVQSKEENIDPAEFDDIPDDELAIINNTNYDPEDGDSIGKDSMQRDSLEEEHISNSEREEQFDERSKMTEIEEPFDESSGTENDTDAIESLEEDHIDKEHTPITNKKDSTNEELNENDEEIEKSDSQVFIYQVNSAGSADAIATARLSGANASDNDTDYVSKTHADEEIEEAIELVTEEVRQINLRQDDECSASKNSLHLSESQSAAEVEENNFMKEDEYSVSINTAHSAKDETCERTPKAVTTIGEQNTLHANRDEAMPSKEDDEQEKRDRERAVVDRSRKVKFKQRYPVPPQVRKPRDPAEIIMEYRKVSSKSSLQTSKPKKDLSELLDAAIGTSLARRSNACGALKVLSTQKKNKLTLVRTAGFLDAMVFAMKDGISDGDREHGITARIRAVNVVLNVSEAKDNRHHILSHPGMTDALVKCMVDDDGEGRVMACAALATLAKTGHCRGSIAAAKSMIEILADILKGNEPSRHRRGDKRSSRKSKSRHTEEEKKSFSDDEDDDSCSTSSSAMQDTTHRRMGRNLDAKKRARMNACAVLLHLSKECSISQRLCSSDTLKNSLVATSGEVNNPIHTKCLEIMCNLSRFPHNNAALVECPGLVDTLVGNGQHDDDIDRLWSVRTLQNLSSDPSAKCILAQIQVLELLSMSMMRQKYDEQLAATSALYNISTEPGAVVPLTNTRNVVATLVHVAHSPTSESTVRTIACDALATLGLWLQTLSGSGTYPEGVTAVPLPSYMTTGWKRWEA
mmetsp:Transcript_2768/g.6006  ORF Transcript_2768/g.6006 Transcript_2768/m.6006 type:complete len:1408 (+) Transcript_2768:454-4677(+)